MDFDNQRRNILSKINEQIIYGNKAFEDMRTRTKNIIETESNIEERLRENVSLRSEAESEFEELLEKENELYDLQLEAQEKLIEIQSMRTVLESSLSKSYPKYKIIADKVESTKGIYNSICNEEETQRGKLKCQIAEYSRMRSEAEILNKLKRTL